MKVLYFIIFLALSTLVGVLNYNHAPNYDTDVVALEDINQVLSEAEKTILKVMISRQIEFHNQHLLLPKKIVIPTRIFDTRKEFKRYQKENTKRSDSNNGFYSRSLREIVIRQNKRAMKTIVHEAQHYIIGSDFRKPPKWLNQGLSEFYEESYVRWKKVYVTVQKKKLSRLEKWVHEDSMIPF